jgi:hypothetical protein
VSFAEEVSLDELNWKKVPGRDYTTASASRAFFISIPAGGQLHRHVDAGDVISYHVVIQTNEQAENFWLEDGKEHVMHMEAGKMYRVDRTLEHWAVNGGDSDRVHLILEFPV